MWSRKTARPSSSARTCAATYRSSSRCAAATWLRPLPRRQAKIAAQRQAALRQRTWNGRGEINQLRDTTARLLIIVPVTLLIITFLVYSSVKNARDTLIVLLGAPVAASGGVGGPCSFSGTDFPSRRHGLHLDSRVSIQDALLVVTSASSCASKASRQKARPGGRPSAGCARS